MDTKQEDALWDEHFDLSWEILGKIRTLIDAKWDANTLKIEIEQLMKQLERINQELNP